MTCWSAFNQVLELRLSPGSARRAAPGRAPGSMERDRPLAPLCRTSVAEAWSGCQRHHSHAHNTESWKRVTEGCDLRGKVRG